MNQQDLQSLTDSELLLRAKQLKNTPIYDAVLFGALIGIAIYSVVKNGFGLLTFIPLVYLPVISKNKAKRKAINEEMTKRGIGAI